MASYNKTKVADLKSLCEKRGLESDGTKTQLMSRLMKQDSELDATAEKATAAAVQAQSGTNPASGTSKGKKKKDLPGAKDGRREQAKKSEKMRKERLGKGRMKQGMGDVKEGEEEEPDVVQSLMAGNQLSISYNTSTQPEGGANSTGIIVNPTPGRRPKYSTATRRTRWENYSPRNDGTFTRAMDPHANPFTRNGIEEGQPDYKDACNLSDASTVVLEEQKHAQLKNVPVSDDEDDEGKREGDREEDLEKVDDGVVATAVLILAIILAAMIIWMFTL